MTVVRLISRNPTPLARPPYGIHDIQRRLGRIDHTVGTVVKLLRDLIEHRGFPPPLGFRRYAGTLLEGAAAVSPKSQWNREAVDAWFGGHDGTPRALFPAMEAAAIADAARTLDARAHQLAGVA